MEPELFDLDKLRATLSAVKFRDWGFRSGEMGDGFFVQTVFVARDTDTGKYTEQRGRKWYVSRHSLEDEVYKTCWLAVETALRHEAMEEFRVAGVAPFHPHTSIDELIRLQQMPEVRVKRSELVTR